MGLSVLVLLIMGIVVVGLNVGVVIVGLFVVGLKVVGLEVGILFVGLLLVGHAVVGLNMVKLNQFRFQPPLVALMPKIWEPASRFTVCEIVCQFCQPPVTGMLSDPYTCVPPAFSNCKLPPPLRLATR